MALLNPREYWENRVLSGGVDSVSTVGDVSSRTEEEIDFLIGEISKVCPQKVDLAIDFGAGWGRLLPVLKATAVRQVLVDFALENERLWEENYPKDESYFMVCPIGEFKATKIADYAMTSFSLLHILDPEEFTRSAGRIKNSVKPGGHLFLYESYNESGTVAPHCSNRNRKEFLAPFEDCHFVKEVDWESSYQPYETKCRQPIKLFIFRR